MELLVLTRTRPVLLVILWLLVGTVYCSKDVEFQFSQHQYRASIEEDARPGVNVTDANPDIPLGISVPYMTRNDALKFSLLSIIGSKTSDTFEPIWQVVGNFAFLQIRLMKRDALNREKAEKKLFQYYLVASIENDAGVSQQARDAQIDIEVLDNNDNMPTIRPDAKYTLSLPEDFPVHSKVVQITTAWDSDLGINSQIYFSFASKFSLKQGTFSLHPTNGQIRLLRPLNFDLQQNFVLTVQAHDRASLLFGSRFDSSDSNLDKVKVNITVYPINRHSPVIEHQIRGDPMPALKRNETSLLAYVRITDADDTGTHGTIGKVRIIDGDPKLIFMIQPPPIGATGSQKGLYRIIIPKNVTKTVVANKQLERTYQLTLYAEDAGFPIRNTTKVVKISVPDQIEPKLKFEKQTYKFVANETLPRSAYIGIVSAVRDDALDSGAVTLVQLREPRGAYTRYALFTVQNGDALPFTINNFSGMIYLATKLDYETRRSYTFIAHAFNAMYTSSGVNATVTVDVLDQNDNDPVFSLNFSVTVPLQHDAAAESIVCRVNATDADSGDNAKISYHIASPAPSQHPFFIDQFSGVLKLRYALAVFQDSLQAPEESYRLLIRASDQGLPFRRESELDVLLKITDDGEATTISSSVAPQLMWRSKRETTTKLKNNHKPQWPMSMPLVLSFPENATVGEPIRQLRAVDQDSGFAGWVRYSITGGNDDGLFMIDPNTGELAPVRPLDRERTAKYELQLTAWDFGTPVDFVERTIELKLIDSNDNEPIFEQPVYKIDIDEDTKDKSDILKLSANDFDEGRNADIHYQFLTEVMDFKISPSGVVSVVGSLDREKRDFYAVTVQAIDRGLPSLAGETRLEITINDVNDNAPECVDKKTAANIYLPEDYPVNSLVRCIQTVDLDRNERTLSFSFSKSLMENGEPWPFRLDSDSGCLWLDSRLDYESRSMYLLPVSVTDGELSSLCQFTVKVVDVNENRYAPVFEQYVMSGSLYENMPPETRVLQVTATDPDGESEGLPLIYSIRGGDGRGLFEIDQSGVITSLRKLDCELKSHYWLEVFAEDRAPVSLVSKMWVFVKVVDVNDHYPVPGQPVYYADVSEDEQPDQMVLFVQSTDRDDATGLRYTFSGGNTEALFDVDTTTGYIKTASGTRKLNREMTDTYELELLVSDGAGRESLSSSILVVINITDVNDITPWFPSAPEQSVQVFETEEIDQYLFGIPVRAVDDDLGPNGRVSYDCEVIDEEFKDIVSVERETGKFYSKKPLIGGTEFDIRCSASDDGSPEKRRSDELRFEVIVKKKPSKSVRCDVRKKDSFNLAALHKAGNHLDVLYEGGTAEDFVNVRSNGELTVAANIQYVPQGSYNLTIGWTNGLEEFQKMLTFNVTKPKVYERPVLDDVTVSLHEDTNPGESITTMKAVSPLPDPDADEKDKLNLVYTIIDSEHAESRSIFRIHPVTGEVILQEKLLDHEATQTHIMTVKCSNRGVFTLARLIVKVKDVNDNVPRFLQESDYRVQIPETTLKNTSIIQLVAFDPDSSEAGRIEYSIESGNAKGIFKIDSSSGKLLLASDIDLTQQDYALTVTATDHGIPRRSQSTPVIVHVFASETSVPIFDKSRYKFDVSEDAKIGAFLFSVHAKSTTSIWYEFVDNSGANQFFLLVPSSGAVFLKGSLDFERTRSINFSISAKSPNSEKSFSIVHVDVAVVDVNDHAPIFTQSVYTGKVAENLKTGSIVTTWKKRRDGLTDPLSVLAIDLDTGANGHVVYEIRDSWAAKYFMVDHGTGTLVSKQPLDYEMTPRFTFDIYARDNGKPSLVSYVPCTVIIDVIDGNDNAPKFERDFYSFNVYLPTVDGTWFGRVWAIDPDQNGAIRYLEASPKHPNFKLNVDTGDFTVQNSTALQSSVGTKSMIRVKATDGLHRHIVDVTIHVKDLSEGERGFKFEQAVQQVSVLENQNHSQTLLVLSMAMSKVGDVVSFHLLNGEPWFAIAKTSGVLTTTGVPLDRELAETIVLIVQARDRNNPPRVAQAMVKVNVQDQNDNKPEFFSEPYYARFANELPVGSNLTQVVARDADSGRNAEIEFTLETTAGVGFDDYFEMDKNTGELILSRAMGSDMVNQVFDLIVMARDKGHPALSTTTKIGVKIRQRGVPVFHRPYFTVDVQEDASVDHSLLVLNAEAMTDGRLIYTIIEGNDENKFVVHYESVLGPPGPCELKLASTLDYETTKSYKLTIEATDLKSGLGDTVRVIVNVIDVNDNAPVFTTPNNLIYVYESAYIGPAILPGPLATDSDTGLNGRIFYEMKLLNEMTGPFTIDMNSGDVSVAKSLDYEVQASYIYEVTAYDYGIPSLSSTTMLMIQLVDQNDNRPRFAKGIYDAVMTSTMTQGQFLTVVQASDRDVESRKRLVYQIVSGDRRGLFELDSKKGKLTLATDLQATTDLKNVDMLRQYLLNVSVSDGVFSDYCQVKIDYKPGGKAGSLAFDRAVYKLTIAENQGANQPLLNPKLQLTNSGLRVKFKIVTTNSGTRHEALPFRIVETTGELFTRNDLDYERQRKYSFVVQATNRDRQTALADVTVEVTDQNDNTPTFLAKGYHLTVPANAENDAIVGQIKATDADADDQIYYRFEAPNDLFAMTPKTGEVVVKNHAALTALANKKRVYQVLALDSDNPPNQESVGISIFIASPSESLPKFSQTQFQFKVAEERPIATLVGGTKANFAGSLAYSILAGSSGAENYFSIDKFGDIKILQQLDREQHDRWNFHVEAHAVNQREKAAVVLVTVFVLDFNDNAPSFSGSYTDLTVSEDTPIGSQITKFRAADPDLDKNGIVQYRLEAKEPDVLEHFEVEATSGALFIKTPLDRERKNFYSFSVIAYDLGKESQKASTLVYVVVQDVNDSPPSFNQKLYNVSVSESAPKLTQLDVDITVTDPDSSASKLETEFFILDGNEENLFNIRLANDKKHINLFLNEQLDFETSQVHRLTILASDGLYQDTAEVLVSVVDVDDNYPKCTQGHVKLNVSEGEKSGFKVYQFDVTDADKQHQTLIYTIEGSLDFTVDEHGAVTIDSSINRETQSKYHLTLTARDGAGHMCVTVVEIFVTDVNDEVPQFPASIKDARILEELPPDRHPIAQLRAVDGDPGAGGVVTYRLMNDFDGKFEIGKHSGVVLVLKQLDREEISRYNLTIIATDGGKPPLSSTAQLAVLVTDINDNPPVFKHSRYEFSVDENTREGFEIDQLLAISRDAGENAAIGYHIVGEQDKFSIDTFTGVLRVVGLLDHEVENEYHFNVEARDAGKPPGRVQAQIKIIVNDLNDNEPKCSMDLYKFIAIENAPMFFEVGQLVCDDADSKEDGNGVVRYKILSQDGGEHFQINDTGWISIKSQLDYETAHKHDLTVTVSDRGSRRQSRIINVEIVVQDVNDNSPSADPCPKRVSVQENAEPGHKIHSFKVSDRDSSRHAGPFQVSLLGPASNYFEVRGGESDTFSLFITQSLKSIRDPNNPLSSPEPLKLTVWIHDHARYRNIQCKVTITIIEESKYAPNVTQLTTNIKLFNGQFVGGTIGKLLATDRDKQDTATFSIVPGQTLADGTKLETIFKIDSETGSISAMPTLDAHNYQLNVTVSDGIFNTVSTVEVNVEVITRDMLDSSLTVQIEQISPKQFLKLRNKFTRAISNGLAQRPVTILSIEPDTDTKRRRRRYISGSGTGSDLNVAFVVRDVDYDGPRPVFMDPDLVAKELNANTQQLQTRLKNTAILLAGRVTSSPCNDKDICAWGECFKDVTMDGSRMIQIHMDSGPDWYAPAMVSGFQCRCQAGYTGYDCTIKNDCANDEICSEGELCIPHDSHSEYHCSCPPGFGGTNCRLTEPCPFTGKYASECSNQLAYRFDGTSYLRYEVSDVDLETRFDLSLQFRTHEESGTLMFVSGNRPGVTVQNYMLVSVQNKHIRFSFGNKHGDFEVTVNDVEVSDGLWHSLLINKAPLAVSIRLDEGQPVSKSLFDGSGSSKATVSLRPLVFVYFGANVTNSPLHKRDLLTNAFLGCLDQIKLKGKSIIIDPTQKLVYHNVHFDCNSPICMTPESPCANGGHCVPFGVSGFKCYCPPGYLGEACESVNLIGANECLMDPCGSHGDCSNIEGGTFRCSCHTGWSGSRCETADDVGASIIGLKWQEILIIVAVLVAIILVALLIAFCCRRFVRQKRKDKKEGQKYKKSPYLGNNADSLLPDRIGLHHNDVIFNPTRPVQPVSALQNNNFQHGHSTPPALPPRQNRRPHRNSKFSNLESALSSGIPTVQVRPLSYGERDDSPVMSSNLERARNYGSAADDLENEGRNDDWLLMRTFGKEIHPASHNIHQQNQSPAISKRTPQTAEALRIPQSHSDNQADKLQFKSDRLKDLSVPSADSIERIKQSLNDDASKSENPTFPTNDMKSSMAPSMNSIQCLSEDDNQNAYQWDYSDWNSTLGGEVLAGISGLPTTSNEYDKNYESDDVCSDVDLPKGVCALEETDSEYVGDDDDDVIPEPFIPNDVTDDDFKKQLLNMQRFGAQPQPREPVDDPLSDSLAFKSVGLYQKHMDKYFPKKANTPSSSKSERRGLLDRSEGQEGYSSDSDAEDLNSPYGFPFTRGGSKIPKLIQSNINPPSVNVIAPKLSSFTGTKAEHAVVFPLPGIAGNSSNQLKIGGKKEMDSMSDVSGLCDIDDSDID